MANTKEGGKKVAETNRRLYGADYYSRIGKLGGSVKTAKGFAKMDKDKVSKAGRLGGSLGKRGKSSEYSK